MYIKNPNVGTFIVGVHKGTFHPKILLKHYFE
jgi:hypothetical protein